MTVLLVGGGTGGHITPLLAVAHKLKESDSSISVVYVGEKNGKFDALTQHADDIDKKYLVSAGKFRRYHGESFGAKLFDFKTNWQNFCDVFRVIGGFFQALKVLRKTKPDVAFIKGGFIGVPVGLACALKKVPYITHDSDTLPGLANRIIGKWARLHALGMPKEYYNYPKGKMEFVGIPLGDQWRLVDDKLKAHYRHDIGVEPSAKLLCIIGGSLGAQRLNEGLEPVVVRLLKDDKDLYVVHQTGKNSEGLYSEVDSGLKKRLIIKPFMDDVYLYTGAADVVVSRAGATSIAELATQAKATVLVPNPVLTGGHQVKNAKHLLDAGAVEIIEEDSLLHATSPVADRLAGLLRSEERQSELGRKLGTLAEHDSAKKIAQILTDIAKGQ